MPVDRPVDWFLTGPVHRFFTEGFCALFNAYIEKYSDGGGEVLKIKICGYGRVCQKKKRKKIFAYNSILRPF